MTRETIPRCFEGKTVVCIGGGPSLTREDVDCIDRRVPVISVNDAYKLAPWCDVLYAADHDWWDKNIDIIHAVCDAQLWTQSPTARDKYNLHWVILTNEPGLSEDPMTIHGGGHSGYQAFNLAYLMGAGRILLLGYDCQRTYGKDHWFGRHDGGLNQGMDVRDWALAYDSTISQLRKNNVDVINCSRESAITCFPRSTIEKAL